MTTLYLIRHAEAEGNLYRFAQGQYESDITALGYKQIDALAERLRDIKLDALYASDLRRTQITAGAITRYHELELSLCPGLREICIGRFEGMSFGNMAHEDPELMRLFRNDPDRWHAPGAETFPECAQRMSKTLTRIAEENDGKCVAVVSHGLIQRSFFAQICGIPSDKIGSFLHGDNTAVSLLHYENGSFTARYLNDSSHISGGLSRRDSDAARRIIKDGIDISDLYYLPLDPSLNADTYVEYYRSAWLAAHGNLTFFTPEWFLKKAVRHYSEQPESLVGIYRGDELIGILELDAERGRKENYGWISLICLRSDLRGLGYGVQPLGYAILYFKRLGRSALRLHVSAENEKAVGFYKHHGFEIIDVGSGAGAPLYLMEKNFNAVIHRR